MSSLLRKSALAIGLIGLTLTSTAFAGGAGLTKLNQVNETFLSESDINVIMSAIEETKVQFSCPTGDFQVEHKITKAVDVQDFVFLSRTGDIKQSGTDSRPFGNCDDNQLEVLSYCIQSMCIKRETQPAQLAK